MKTIEIRTEAKLNKFVKENRGSIQSINGIDFSNLYPMLEVTNKHASYYDVSQQCNRYISAPFTVVYTENK